MSEFLYVLSLSVKNQVVSFHRNIIQHLSCIQQASTSYQSTATNPQKPMEETTLATSKQYQQITPHLGISFTKCSPLQNLGKSHIPQILSLKNFGGGYGIHPVFFLFFSEEKTPCDGKFHTTWTHKPSWILHIYIITIYFEGPKTSIKLFHGVLGSLQLTAPAV